MAPGRFRCMDDFDSDFALSPDALIWLACALLLSTVLLGAGLLLVLAIPALAAEASRLLPAVVITSLMLAPPAAVPISRRMRLRNWGRKAWVKGDFISG